MFPNSIHDNDCLYGAQGPLAVPSAYAKLLAQNEQILRQNTQLLAQVGQLCARLDALEATVRDILKPLQVRRICNELAPRKEKV